MELEYKANDVSKISITDWAPKLDDYPYTGKGFTGSVDVVLPEYFQDTRKFMDGDIFNIIDSDTWRDYTTIYLWYGYRYKVGYDRRKVKWYMLFIEIKYI